MQCISKWIEEWDPNLIPKGHCGYGCGKGWHPMIKIACRIFSDLNEKYPDEPPIQIDQIKEKFGGLRFYISGGGKNWKLAQEIASHCETFSWYICEECGDSDTACPDNSRSWVKTLCNECSGRNNQGN